MIDLIKSQVLSEKTSKLLEKNVYVFDVDKRINKQSLKLVLNELFGVKVISVNSYILPSKKCRLGKFSGYKGLKKRVFVLLEAGMVIPFFSGL